MSNDEKVIQELKQLAKSPQYNEVGSSNQTLNKESLLKKAKKVAENLDRNASASTSVNI